MVGCNPWGLEGGSPRLWRVPKSLGPDRLESTLAITRRWLGDGPRPSNLGLSSLVPAHRTYDETQQEGNRMGVRAPTRVSDASEPRHFFLAPSNGAPRDSRGASLPAPIFFGGK